jgi:arylsulfatase A-like enzyme
VNESVSGMRRRLGGALRGAVLGLVVGALWFALEAGTNWAAGGVVPGYTLARIAQLDVALAGIAGLVLGVLLPQGGVGLGLAMGAAYGFMRVFAPPGMGAEAIYVLVAAAAVALGMWLTRRDGSGVLAFLHTALLGAAAILGLDFALDSMHAGALRGMRLPIVMAALPLVALVLDRALALILRRRGLRFGLELAAAGVALAVLGSPLATAPIDNRVVTAVPPPRGTPDVFLISLDTTRADRLSLYGYGRPTSPQLEALAADGLTYTQARSTAGWTLPGHASMLTGMYPSRHGAHLAGGWLPGQSIDGRRNVAFPLAADKTTLAEALRDRGYTTGGFVANFSYIYRDFGLAQGFQRYDDAPGILLRVRPPVVRFAQHTFDPGFCLKPFRTAADINQQTLAWLDEAPAGRPVFAFLNYMEAHQPWLAPPPHDRWVWDLPQARRLATKDLYTHEVKQFTPEEIEFIRANYDGQLAAMDEALGQLVAELKRRGRYDNALIIVTSDHGDLLGEHGFVGHMGRMLYEQLLHVPMVVKFPGADRPRGRVDTQVQVLDVTPTVLAEAGAPILAGMQGEDLRHVTRPTLAEEDINPFLVSDYGATYDRAIRVLFDGSWKLITTSKGQRMLFDLSRDPQETTDLSASEPDRVDELARRLEATLSTMVAGDDRSRARAPEQLVQVK